MSPVVDMRDSLDQGSAKNYETGISILYAFKIVWIMYGYFLHFIYEKSGPLAGLSAHKNPIL